MRRRGAILALGVALLAFAPASAEAKTQCQKLNAKHDLAPAGKVKLVRRDNGDAGGNDLVGCVLPAGKLVVAAFSGAEGSGGGAYDLRQVAGHHVLVHQSDSTPSAYDDYTQVVDLKTGRRYKVAFSCFDTAPCNGNTTAKRALINSSGQAVAIVHRHGSDLVSVEGFSS